MRIEAKEISGSGGLMMAKKQRSFESMVESKIQEGINQGILNDLPGKGKPLDFDEPHAKSEYWAANKIMKNANFEPKWLKLAKEIRENKEELLKMIETHGRWLEEQKELLPEVKSSKRKQLLDTTQRVHEKKQAKYMKLVQEINPKTREMNLLVPTPQLQKKLIDERLWEEQFVSCSKQYDDVLKIAEQLAHQKKTSFLQKLVKLFLG